ncbi:MAG TPA: HAMP domain-containing sensor histidine kinase [bacterium]|nr:HAMP domain-containing sensor histidine kinase [bacterium]
MTLTKKIILTFGIIFVLTFFINKYYIKDYAENVIIRDNLENISASANFFHSGLRKAFELGLQIDQISGISEELERFKNEFEQIDEIFLVDDNNIIIAHNSPGKHLLQNEFPDRFSLSQIKESSKIFSDNFCYLAYKFSDQPWKKNYFMIIKVNIDTINNRYSSSIWNYLIYSVSIITLFIIVIIFIMYSFITKPFRKILLQLNNIINLKKYDSRIIRNSNDYEFKILTDYINNLLQIVFERENQLIGYNAKLNEEIKKRTEKLNATVLELKLANEKLLKADQIKDDFLSVVTHELKTPLTTIRAYVETIQSGIADESEKSDFYNIIISEVTRLTRLINNVLDLNKYERNKLKLNLEQCNLSVILKQIISGAVKDVQDKNIALINSISDSVNQNITADKDRITQVLYNIINNAVKFNKKNGTVSIDASKAFKHQFPQFDDLKSESYILIKISDTGIGIKEENIAKIWEKFSRVSDDYFEGAGLGLAVSKGIIEILKGKIWAESVFGEGTTFFILLPAGE